MSNQGVVHSRRRTAFHEKNQSLIAVGGMVKGAQLVGKAECDGLPNVNDALQQWGTYFLFDQLHYYIPDSSLYNIEEACKEVGQLKILTGKDSAAF